LSKAVSLFPLGLSKTKRPTQSQEKIGLPVFHNPLAIDHKLNILGVLIKGNSDLYLVVDKFFLGACAQEYTAGVEQQPTPKPLSDSDVELVHSLCPDQAEVEGLGTIAISHGHRYLLPYGNVEEAYPNT